MPPKSSVTLPAVSRFFSSAARDPIRLRTVRSGGRKITVQSFKTIIPYFCLSVLNGKKSPQKYVTARIPGTVSLCTSGLRRIPALFRGFQKNPAGGNGRIFCSSVCHAAFTSSLPASDSRDRYARSTRSAKPAEEKPQNTDSLAALPNLRRKSLSVRRLHSFTENSFSSE